MVNFENIKFLKSYKTKPEDLNLPQVLFVGRSNVGKSTLINKLTGIKKLAYVSNKPGHTKLLNIYQVSTNFLLVDAPGYGYSASNKYSFIEYNKIMNSYFDNNKYLRFVVLLIDSRRDFSDDDISMLEYLNHYNIDYLVVFTKCDKINQKEKHQLEVRIKENSQYFKENTKYFYSNISKKDNLNDLKEYLSNNI